MTASAEGEGAGGKRERATQCWGQRSGQRGDRHAEMVVRAGAGRQGIGARIRQELGRRI